MKRFAAALLAGVMVLGSAALGDEIVFEDGLMAENEAIEISADVELEEGLFDAEDGLFAEDEIEEELFEEITEPEFSSEEDWNADSLIEDVEETTDEDALALADNEDIQIDEAHFPDGNFRNFVSVNYDKDHNGSLSSGERSAVSSIDVKNEHIKDLKGIEYFTALKYLICSSNQLTSLDVSQCTALRELDCAYNQLTSLDVSHNTDLCSLYCESNNLTRLNISKCPYIEKAYLTPTRHVVDEGLAIYEYDDGNFFSFSCDATIFIIDSTHSHSFGDWMITTPATCTTVGVKTCTCLCGEAKTELIPATGIHTPVTDPAVPATAASTGLTEGSHCSVCGTVLVAQQTIPMTEQITVPKKPAIKKPAAAKNKITANWTNIKTTSKKTKAIWKKIKKVQVQCATDKAFTSIVKTMMTGKNKTKATFKGLKKNTTYYVRVRYYDGTGYSRWSSVKKIKTKKK